MAGLLHGQQKFAEARDLYVPFVSVRPDDTGALTNLAVSLSALGNADDAVKRAVELATGGKAA